MFELFGPVAKTAYNFTTSLFSSSQKSLKGWTLKNPKQFAGIYMLLYMTSNYAAGQVFDGNDSSDNIPTYTLKPIDNSEACQEQWSLWDLPQCLTIGVFLVAHEKIAEIFLQMSEYSFFTNGYVKSEAMTKVYGECVQDRLENYGNQALRLAQELNVDAYNGLTGCSYVLPDWIRAVAKSTTDSRTKNTIRYTEWHQNDRQFTLQFGNLNIRVCADLIALVSNNVRDCQDENKLFYEELSRAGDVLMYIGISIGGLVGLGLVSWLLYFVCKGSQECCTGTGDFLRHQIDNLQTVECCPSFCINSESNRNTGTTNTGTTNTGTTNTGTNNRGTTNAGTTNTVKNNRATSFV